MSLPIFYLPALETTGFVQLSEETSKHIVQVLRMRVGEKMQLTDGMGTRLTTEIVDDHKKKCTVKIIEGSFQPKAEKEVCVAISLLKNASRFEWFLEKATELGVTEIIPLLSGRTEKQHFRFERMNNIVISAMLQSQQVWLPKLHEPLAFDVAISTDSYNTQLIAHCIEEQKASIRDVGSFDSAQILIGPEGDFTPAEIEVALKKGYKPVALGNTRLRTETAGVVAATFLCI